MVFFKIQHHFTQQLICTHCIHKIKYKDWLILKDIIWVKVVKYNKNLKILLETHTQIINPNILK
jgi:hypothetical protein